MPVDVMRVRGDAELSADVEIEVVEHAIIADVLARLLPIGLVAAVVAIGVVAATSLAQPLRFLPPGIALALQLIAWRELRRGQLGRALGACLIALAGAIGFGLALNGGLDAPIWKLVYFVIVVSAWTFGRRGSAAMTLVVSGLALTIIGLDALDVLPPAPPQAQAFKLAIALLTAWLVWFASSLPQQRFRQALTRALTHERELAAEQARRIRAEDERRELADQLHHAQKMQAIGTLAGGIAHDFNNILASVVANLELVRGDLGAAHPALESIDAIEQGATRATELVRQILMFSHKEPSARAVLPLAGVVPEATAFLRAAKPASIALAVEVAASPYVLADPTRLHQVIMNLGTNAWHAIAPGAGHVTIRVDAIDAPATATLPAGRYARLIVTDDGHGMDAALRARIFEPFFTTKGLGKGSGLGLAVVHGIVAEHGGTIIVTSEPGRGSAFEVRLPAVDAPAEPLALPAPAIAAPGHGQRIFLVDDEVALVRAGARGLERLGYHVTTFARAEDALDALRVDPRAADLVITDHGMPGMSGLTLAAELARLRPALPVVLISGQLDDGDPIQVPHRLAKPYRAHELAALLRTLLPQV